jgi:predicted Zn-dependent protease
MNNIESWARQAAPACDFWSIRAVTESSEQLMVRQNVAEAPVRSRDAGVMVSVVDGGGLGYAATSNVSERGLKDAFAQAKQLAQAVAGKSVFDYRKVPAAAPHGSYSSKVAKPISTSLKEKFDLLSHVCASAKTDDRIVDWSAGLWTTHTEQLFITSAGGRAEQVWDFVVPNVTAVASANGETQTRSAAGQYNGFCQQGGFEVLERAQFMADVLLMPDQMMLQIHESIGHPLELDRILGDERNFAGTSFVTLDMFGKYQYGSALLNVTFDPTRTEQFATFAFDDDGASAAREYIIKDGILMRPLGGAISQARAGMAGVSTARACSWNRAPIDRMSNLNIEPGTSNLQDMIASIEHGVLMRTNCSWSIDDSRNKFQFSCEHGQVIRNGKLAEVIKNPSYRGISATFWRSLSMVGDASTFEVMGTPFCGKGEPSQVIRVGHASPACKFSNVDVFGAA